MFGMFTGCSSLTSINLSNFNTSQVTEMFGMFAGCSSLTSLELSNFDTSQVQNMNYMFYKCSSLISLDLSNFNTSIVRKMNNMFSGCINLEYINLANFDERKIESQDYIFSNVQANVVICANGNFTKHIIFEQKDNIKCHAIDCSINWKLKQKKIINNINECIDSCDNSTQYKYEYNGKCYENCSNGFLYDNNSNIINKCKCELDKCLMCPQVALDHNLCTKCNINYYPKENDPKNIGEYINCYKQPEEGYYLDNNSNLLRKCYHTCKTCNISGNNLSHNCLECNDNVLFIIKANIFFNCYENCRYYHYYDNENNLHCTLNLSCPEKYPKLKESNNECFKYDIKDIIKDLDINNEKNESDKLKIEEIEYYNTI